MSPDHPQPVRFHRREMAPLVVLINGLSATGKTTIGRGLAQRLALPLFAKDAVKERLFDNLGVNDYAWSHHLSSTTHTVLNYVFEELLSSGIGFIMEANFNPKYDAVKYESWREKHGCRIVQVLCWAHGEVVLQRFTERALSGRRHPGHNDDANLEAFKSHLMQGRGAPLAIHAPLIEVDTTDFGKVNLDDLARQIQEAI